MMKSARAFAQDESQCRARWLQQRTGLDTMGFTIVEVLIAIVVLAVGLLGTAGTTVLLVRQTTLADVTTDRAVALQTTLERIQALPFDSVLAGQDSVGRYEVSWTVLDLGQWKQLEFITDGPGLSTAQGFPSIATSVPDTFSFRILKP